VADKRSSIYILIDALSLRATERVESYMAATRRPLRYTIRLNLRKDKALIQIKPTHDLLVLAWAVSVVAPTDVLGRGDEAWAQRLIYENKKEPDPAWIIDPDLIPSPR